MSDNAMNLGVYQFTENESSFRFISESSSGPGWDFDFKGECVNDKDDLFEYGFRLYTEAAPLGLTKHDDLTGLEIVLPKPYDEESGEPFFGFKVWEEHEVSDLTLRFLRRDGDKYLIEINATVAATVLGKPAPLHLQAWTRQPPDRAYPS